MRQEGKAIDSLISLGLTDLESRIYIFLLKENPATGYGIARAVARPVANVYKAVMSLEQKGAVIVEEDRKRLCRPVPIAEFLRQVERRFGESQKRVMEELAKLESISEDEGVYRIRSVEQVFERSRSMLARATRAITIDAFPGILNDLLPDIRRKARSGIEIIVKAYQPVSVPHVKVVVDSRGGGVVNDYPGHWLKLIVDARESLLAFISADAAHVHQAVWSRSSFLALLLHHGILSEVMLDEIKSAAKDADSVEPIRRILAGYVTTRKKDLPGYRALIKQFSRGIAG